MRSAREQAGPRKSCERKVPAARHPEMTRTVTWHCYNSRFSRLAQIFRELKMLGFGHSSRQGAKTPSSERKTLCHLDRREKSFIDPSHLLGMTGLGSSPLRLGVFAGDNPISAFAFLAPFAVNDPGPNPLWLRLRRAKPWRGSINSPP